MIDLVIIQQQQRKKKDDKKKKDFLLSNILNTLGNNFKEVKQINKACYKIDRTKRNPKKKDILNCIKGDFINIDTTDKIENKIINTNLIKNIGKLTLDQVYSHCLYGVPSTSAASVTDYYVTITNEKILKELELIEIVFFDGSYIVVLGNEF